MGIENSYREDIPKFPTKRQQVTELLLIKEMKLSYHSVGI